MTLRAEPVARQGAELGEGAFWHAPAQRLYWVDITGKTVFVYDPATGKNRAIPVGSDVGTIVPRKSGGAIIALKDGFASLNLETGAVKMLAKVEADLPNNRFNDGKCDPAGRFWAGSMAYDFAKGAGSLYCMDTKHNIRKVISHVTISNGLAWTEDQKIFYYIDSGASCIVAYDYRIATGQIGNRRVVVTISPDEGFLDGMTIDENDNLWVAIWKAGQIRCWDPRTGALLEVIEVPGAKLTTSCSFGGLMLDELYITSASGGLSESERAEQPLAGALFRVKPGVKGVLGFAFGG
jgi:sugar lactone lactonase YvrE